MIHKFLFFLVCFSLLFLNSIPLFTDISTWIFCFFILLFIIIYPNKYLEARINRNIFMLMVAGFLFLNILVIQSVFIKLVPINDVIRATIPFVFLFFSIPFYFVLLKNNNFGKYSSNVVIATSTIFSLYNIWLFITVYMDGLMGLKRITLLDPITTAPWPLFGAVILTNLLGNKSNFSLKLLLLLINIIGFSITLTRSMILVYLSCVVIMVIISFVRKKDFKKLIKIFIGSIILLLILGQLIRYSYIFNSIYISIIGRFDNLTRDDNNVSERVLEFQSALEILSENPLIGGGLGVRFSEHEFGVFVNYIHNAFLYSLANIGLINTVVIYSVLVYIIFKLIFSNNLLHISYGYGLLSLTFYSMFFATFKLIHHNFLLALCIAFFFSEIQPKGNRKEDVKLR